MRFHLRNDQVLSLIPEYWCRAVSSDSTFGFCVHMDESEMDRICEQWPDVIVEVDEDILRSVEIAFSRASVGRMACYIVWNAE